VWSDCKQNGKVRVPWKNKFLQPGSVNYGTILQWVQIRKHSIYGLFHARLRHPLDSPEAQFNEWLRTYELWPPGSPDLNPCDYLRGSLQNCLCERSTSIKGHDGAMIEVKISNVASSLECYEVFSHDGRPTHKLRSALRDSSTKQRRMNCRGKNKIQIPGHTSFVRDNVPATVAMIR
jgi:hypothetical protein